MKTYQIAYSDNIAMGAAITDNFVLTLPGRKITLKSILISRRLFDPATGALIQEESNTNQYLLIRIGDTGGIFTNSFRAGTGTTAPVRNGTYLEIVRPGQYFFNWSDFTNSINFYYSAGNGGPVMIQHNIDFLIEIEDKISYL